MKRKRKRKMIGKKRKTILLYPPHKGALSLPDRGWGWRVTHESDLHFIHWYITPGENLSFKINTLLLKKKKRRGITINNILVVMPVILASTIATLVTMEEFLTTHPSKTERVILVFFLHFVSLPFFLFLLHCSCFSFWLLFWTLALFYKITSFCQMVRFVK